MADQIILAFQKGGLWMWAILFFQITSLVIIAERVLFLFFKRREGQKRYAEGFAGLIRRGELKQALAKAEKDRASSKGGEPAAAAIEAGVQALLDCGGPEDIQGKMDEALRPETAALEKRTPFLVMLGNVGTLTGLLGTIMGMIKAFSAVTYASPAEKAVLLSSGVSEAMNTTAYGLIMAIPALFMFAVLQNRAGSLQEDLSQGALKIFNLLSYSCQAVYEKQPIPAKAPAPKASPKARAKSSPKEQKNLFDQDSPKKAQRLPGAAG